MNYVTIQEKGGNTNTYRNVTNFQTVMVLKVDDPTGDVFTTVSEQLKYLQK